MDNVVEITFPENQTLVLQKGTPALLRSTYIIECAKNINATNIEQKKENGQHTIVATFCTDADATLFRLKCCGTVGIQL